MNEKILNPGINEDSIYFNSKGREMYVCLSHLPKYPKIKLAFSWCITSVYEGSRFKHLLKRFFTTWRIREYKR